MSDEKRTVIALKEQLNAKGKPLFKGNSIRTHKYTVLTFLPLNLYHQFSRLANFYFLIIVLLLQFDWAPISASAALFPLTIVIGISAIREAIEDFLRWRSDQKVNATPAMKLKDGAFTNCRWDEIIVGDFIMVKKNEQVPADIVLISSSIPTGNTYIDTCNLDGETNLKIKQAIKQTMEITEPQQLINANMQVECDLPNNNLYTFNGNITVNGSQYPLDDSALLLRGCVLRNTDHIIGLVVYTGHDTKIMMNSCDARTKRSKLERGLNWKLVSIFVTILSLSLAASIAGIIFETKTINKNKIWYFYRNMENRRNPAYAFFILLVSHIIVINAMIPISLYVTLEVVRVFQAMFVTMDSEMYDVDIGVGCSSRTTNISDDLGQIEYIFSDKTGTLTRNVMDFMKCSINGVIYGSGVTEVGYAAAKRQGLNVQPPKANQKFEDEKFFKLLKEGPPDEIKHFLLLLSTCHAVIPEPDSNAKHGVAFNAPSPDEGALTAAVADMGYVFKARSADSITVEINGEETKIELLANLEFTSARKRSSVVIRHPDTNKYILYMKGADDTILERCKEKTDVEIQTRAHLTEFSNSGLRTLCLAYKELDEEWVMGWSQRLKEANCLVNGREEAVETVCEEIERDVVLIGATAIEDKLQEGVPDAIDSMLRAGIHVWMITGDKRETAINIGFACSLLSSDMAIVTIDEHSIATDIERAEGAPGAELALVITGSAIPKLLEEYVDRFIELTKRCHSVICCRVSPIQKAHIVKVMRDKTKAMALAIGDGANDVGMILEADVGIGISGKEGRQAVLASDYAFGRFRFLKRLLLVHGRMNLYRNIECIFYSFYKNMTFTFNQMIFACYSHFSGQTMYDSMLYTVFNVFFTSIPIVAFSAYDRDIPLEDMMEYPELYKLDGKKKWLQSYPRFLLNLLYGVAHAFVAFYLTYLMCGSFVSPDGFQVTLAEFAATVYQCVVAIVNVKIACLFKYWNWMPWLFVWGSILIFPLILLLIDVMKISKNVRGLSIRWLRMPQMWFAMVASMILVSIPLVIEIVIKSGMNTLKNRILLARKLQRKKSQRVGTSSELSDVSKTAESIL